MGGVAVIAARTGIHRRYKHKRCRIGDGVFGTADGDLPVLKGLAQHLQRVLVKLRELVAEEHTIMCQTDFARHGVDPTAH